MKDLLFFNPILVIVFTSWIIAQTLKFIIRAANGDINIYTFVSTGGMPSGHSAVVCALATTVGLSSGFSSPIFGVCIALAIIVMHDAVVVRGAAGKQAQILNKMIDKFINQEGHPFHHLKVKLGHTPIEVSAGAILGIAIALIMWNMLYV